VPAYLLLILLLLGLTSACGEDEAHTTPRLTEAEEVSVEGDTTPFQGRVYERKFAFISEEADSLVVIPWFFGARTMPEGVEREVKGWMLRNGGWDAFQEDVQDTPSTRAPWRILPTLTTRIVAGGDDLIESIRFQEAGRRLELGLGEMLADWSGAGGESVRFFAAGSTTPTQDLEGVVLDLRRSRRAVDPSPGEWLFLVSGNNFQLFLDHPDAVEQGEATARAWSRVDFLDRRWPEVTVEWTELRAFERARRDVPVAWRFSTPGREISGELEVGAVHLQALEEEGPILPVEGLFEVRGEVQMEGRAFPVVGLLRHVQP